MAEMERMVRRKTEHKAELNTETCLTTEEMEQLKFRCPACGKRVNLSTFGEHLNEDMKKIKTKYFEENE